MIINSWIQIAIFFVILVALVVLLGRYLARWTEGRQMSLSPVPVDRRNNRKGMLVRRLGAQANTPL